MLVDPKILIEYAVPILALVGTILVGQVIFGTMEKIKLNTIEEAIEDFRKGEFVIIVDDEDRENEGDLVVAAGLITPEKVNFMLKHARGVLCAPITISCLNYMEQRQLV